MNMFCEECELNTRCEYLNIKCCDKAYQKGRADVFTQKEINAIKYAIAQLIDKGSIAFASKDEKRFVYCVPWMDLMDKLEQLKGAK